MTSGRERPYSLVCVMMMLVLVMTLACGAGSPSNETLGRQEPIPTPDRSQVQIIDADLPDGLTDADAINAYQQGYAHMRAAAWFSAIAAYDEAIRIQPAVSGPAAQRVCTTGGAPKRRRTTPTPLNRTPTTPATGFMR